MHHSAFFILPSAFRCHPHPVWHNSLGLFCAIGEGNAALNTPAYNGGFFTPDSSLDALRVPDEVCAHFKDLGDYDYRPAREIADAADTATVCSMIDVDTPPAGERQRALRE